MPSPVYRGDDPGFQTQAVGNYPAKSDVADKDNIYLSDQGWVYRHFKNLDKSEFWDEVIWAGDVTNPPSENDPVDPFGDADPDFLVGDGFQFVSGDYPSADPTIGTVTINAPATGDISTNINFALNAPSGAFASGNTFAWSVTGPGTAVIGTATGTFSGNTPANANTTINFPTAGQYQVTCLVKSSAAASSGSIATTGFGAEVNVPADTIGTVTVNGQTSPQAGTGATYSVSYDGTAPKNDVTYTWTVTPNTGVNIVNPGDNPDEIKLTFTTQGSVVSTAVKCVVTDSSAADSGANDTLTVVPHFVIGTPVLAGPTTSTAGAASAAYSIASYTDQSNPTPSDLAYQWSAIPSTGVSFGSATSATTTVTVATAGVVKVHCTVGSAKSIPTSSTSDEITLTAS